VITITNQQLEPEFYINGIFKLFSNEALQENSFINGKMNRLLLFQKREKDWIYFPVSQEEVWASPFAKGEVKGC
jgi:hypothetical protein